MPAQTRRAAVLDCRTPFGTRIARLEIVTDGDFDTTPVETHPLIVFPAEEARRLGEEPVQLRERGRYEYCLRPERGQSEDLTLLPQRGVRPSRLEGGREDRGLIETQDYCGMMPLTVVRRGQTEPLARCTVEVRSLKLGSREHYRGMLRDIADKCAGLLLDCRAPARLRLDALWEQDARFQEQQFEFLRHTLESPMFASAVDEVFHNPHRRLDGEVEQRDISRPLRAGGMFARLLATSARRVAVPASHPLYGVVRSLPREVSVPSRAESYDTPENRFVKMVLVEFADFLTALVSRLPRGSKGDVRPDNARLLDDATRLRGLLTSQLSRGFLRDLSSPTYLPLGSPVLQRRGGYRELLRAWLQFHASAQLAWDGGADVFAAGARNVATLYEYWLFFQLEGLFRKRFACDQPLHAIVIDQNRVPAQLTLKRGVQLRSPVCGARAIGAGRNLRAELHYNRKFTRREDHAMAGSWTRGVQPDYTLSLWPEEYTQSDAERLELMVHVHFDAKYRVERRSDLVGDELDDTPVRDAEPALEPRGAAKYADLLKMHAYRDAVRRTAGAYVLYPGSPTDAGKPFRGFHEIVPGLGAFAVRPGDDGKAHGIAELAAFVDDLIEHVAARASQHARARYWISRAFGARDTDDALALKEQLWSAPPADTTILVGYVKSTTHLDWVRRGRYNLRADLARSVPIQAQALGARFVVLHGDGPTPVTLWAVKGEPSIWTADELLADGYPGPTSAMRYLCLGVSAVDGLPGWLDARVVGGTRAAVSPRTPHHAPFVASLLDLMKAAGLYVGGDERRQ